MEESTSLYSIEEKPDGFFHLLVDGKTTSCPYATIFPMNGQLGNFQGFMRFSCSTQCPLAELKGNVDQEMTYSVHCGAGAREIKLQAPQAQSAPVISLIP